MASRGLGDVYKRQAYTMAKKQNVPIAFAAWGRQNCPEICKEMRALCNFCFDTPRQLEEFQFGD